MPTYEYECESCGHYLEAFQSMTAAHFKKCPECGKDALKRKIGAGAGIIFKGSGFYETDYKKKDAPKESDGDSKKEGKSETKGEPKKEPKKDSKSSSAKEGGTGGGGDGK
ncbi:MAG: zinc ribbon domain-containing protein [Kiritimatiellaeota bacterium]|nr:zinc ribbon domain-containing protein [Kiritimatiellota bacterium]